jgi:hypothetical protein
MEFLKTVGGKVVGGLVALAVIASAISWWQMEPSTRHAILSGAGKIAAWFGVMLLVPWASFFAVGKVARMESNAAGAALVLGITGLEAAVLAWLFDWSIAGPTAWVFYAAAVLVAGVYNLLACDWIAEKITGT